jgi:hypothetical protein
MAYTLSQIPIPDNVIQTKTGTTIQEYFIPTGSEEGIGAKSKHHTQREIVDAINKAYIMLGMEAHPMRNFQFGSQYHDYVSGTIHMFAPGQYDVRAIALGLKTLLGPLKWWKFEIFTYGSVEGRVAFMAIKQKVLTTT